jgi:hypothetical protein
MCGLHCTVHMLEECCIRGSLGSSQVAQVQVVHARFQQLGKLDNMSLENFKFPMFGMRYFVCEYTACQLPPTDVCDRVENSWSG